MSDDPLHASRIASYGARTLERQCPQLLAYLSAGARVLDVGCNVGSITREVAARVAPGRVTGLDSSPPAIAEARTRGDDVEFVVGDASALPFADGAFDLSYSLAMLNWLRDPVQALREQKRVTRPGGIVAASIADRGTLALYPRSPALLASFRAMASLAEAGDDDAFLDVECGRRAAELCTAAGLEVEAVEAYVPASELAHPLADTFADKSAFLRTTLDERGPFGKRLRFMLDHGLARETLVAARREAEAWIAHPHAMWMASYVFVAARA